MWLPGWILITCTSEFEAAAEWYASPGQVAVILCVPIASELVVNVAEMSLMVPVPIDVPPS